MKKEIFKDVKGFENEYKISNFGKIVSKKRVKIIGGETKYFSKEIIDEIMKDKRFPSGVIVVKDVKIQDEKPTESDDTCPCEACVLRRKLENRGFNN